MPFCPSCGTQVTSGNFCPSCGAAVGGAAAPAGATATSAAGLTDNVAGALCYIPGFIAPILFLILEPYSRNRNIRFHAFQSIFANVAIIALAIVLPIVGAFLVFVPVLGHLLIGAISMTVWLGFMVLWIVLLIKTYQGQKMVLPIIGPLAEKQAG